MLLPPQTGQIVAIKKIHLGQAKEVPLHMHAACLHSKRQCFTLSDMPHACMPCRNMHQRKFRLMVEHNARKGLR